MRPTPARALSRTQSAALRGCVTKLLRANTNLMTPELAAQVMRTGEDPKANFDRAHVTFLRMVARLEGQTPK